MKSWKMTAFTSFGQLLEECIGNLDVDATFLPLIQILTATSSANAGIISNDLMSGKHLVLLASMYTVVQEMGPINRKGNATTGSNTYAIHISFKNLISLLRRGVTNSDTDECKAQTLATMIVLRFLITRTGFCRTFLGDYFEYRPLTGKLDCKHYCSFCLGQVREFTGIFHRIKLVPFP